MGTNNAHNLSINKRLEAGEESIKFTSLVKNIIDGKTNLKSVHDMDLSNNLIEIFDEIFALTVKFSSPETFAEINAFCFGLSHVIRFLVRENAPHPDRMLRDSNKFVLPLPFCPRIKLIPDSKFNLKPGAKFLKLLIYRLVNFIIRIRIRIIIFL